jgi:hypothetical protein
VLPSCISLSWCQPPPSNDRSRHRIHLLLGCWCMGYASRGGRNTYFVRTPLMSPQEPRSLAQHIISLPRKPKLGNGPYVSQRRFFPCTEPQCIIQAEAASVNRELPPTDLPIWQSLDQTLEVFDSAIGHCISHLDRSVRLRVHNIPPTP